MTEARLRVEDCSFGYGAGEFRLHEVSLEVHAGEVLGIVGPNGSGKSTLLRLMSGILKPDAGRVLLGEAPLDSFTRRRLARQVAFLPQEPETSFAFSVREVVAMGRYPYQGAFGFLGRRDLQVVEAAMRDTETKPFADRLFSTLSGGEKQRVLVAAVLAQEPSVMLLDEPTAALDVHHCCDVMDMLWRLSRTGMAVAVVTHDLNAAGQFCDRLALLSGGRVVQCGAPIQVMHQDVLSHAYGGRLRVFENPLTGAPHVTVLGEAAHGRQ